jgi:hypothetical protein
MNTLVLTYLGMAILISSFVTAKICGAVYKRRHRKFIKKHKIVLP